ncbi:MAG TPA: SelB C-terminal domain-containing protein, partial [Candidatus Eremiobacteraceae bacterium]|nr:SelB C-terminal domain-containing protein [Candidatus Eremiobacteraceae bacterium]
TLRLHRPVVFYPGQRCIVRRMSPKDLLGGGVIIAGTATASGAAEPAGGVEALCERVLEAARSAPQPVGTVAAQANVAAGLAQAALDSLVEAGRVCIVEKPRAYVARAAFDDAFASVRRVLRERHRTAPWRVGCTAAEIAADLGEDVRQLERLLAAWRADGRLAKRGTAWHMPEFVPALSAEQRAFFRGALSVGDGPFVPASHARILDRARASGIAGIEEAFGSLLATGALVLVGDDLYRRSQLAAARERIAQTCARYPEGITLAQVRDALGTSRRYALPLMEYFDGIGVTARDGDRRRMLSAAASASPAPQPVR